LGPVGYRPQISISNSAGQPLAVSALRLEPGKDGTAREGLRATRLSISPDNSYVLRPEADARGMLELAGEPGLNYSAWLVGPDGDRVELPVINSENSAQADATLVIQGLEGSSSRLAHLGLVNLGQTAATCSVSVLRADGRDALQPLEFTVAPLSHLLVADLLKRLGSIAEARAEVTCSNDFYAYALIADVPSGRLTVIRPSEPSDDLPQLGEAFEKVVAVPCSEGIMLCSQPLTQPFIVSKTNPSLALTMTPPAGAYSAMVAHVDVQVTGWNPRNVHGAHGVLYVVINRNKWLLGNIFLRGPGKNNVTLRHGVCPQGCQKSKVEKSIPIELGAVYSFDYRYDPANRTTDMTVTLHGQVVARIQDKPNVNKININPGDKIVIGLSNPFPNSHEEPSSLGWRYSNLRLQFIK
jgi:hypothetical protein